MVVVELEDKESTTQTFVVTGVYLTYINLYMTFYLHKFILIIIIYLFKFINIFKKLICKLNARSCTVHVFKIKKRQKDKKTVPVDRQEAKVLSLIY